MFLSLDADPVFQAEHLTGRERTERAVIPEWQLLTNGGAPEVFEPLLQLFSIVFPRVIQNGKCL